MLETYIGVIRFGFSLLFGVALSVSFAGIERTRKNDLAVGFSCAILLLVQSSCWWLFGIDLTSKLYPLIIHLPMILFLSIYLKRPWLVSTVSVLSAYLCCQAPRWFGFLAGAAFGSRLADHIFYIAFVFLAYYFLKRYVAGSVRQLMEKSNKSCVLIGAVPFYYYVFDYVTTIYTDMLYRGAKWAVQFMPSTISIFYFVFIILYYAETQKQASAQKERDMLAAQLQLAKTEFTALRQLQECTAVYRHDMRHHFTFLQGLAAEGSIEKIKEYLNAAEQDMEAITPVRFCENETVNLILSSFASKAKQSGCNLMYQILMRRGSSRAARLVYSLRQRFGNTNCIIHMKELTDFKCQLALLLFVSQESPLALPNSWRALDMDLIVLSKLQSNLKNSSYQFF